jgi:acetyltransferase-like isoleucine patch superfamily enzyme
MKLITEITEKKNLNNITIGENVKIFDFVNLYGCSIDDGSKVGTFVEIQKGASIGKNCKISSHTFICEGVHIADNCFIGHSVVFINDKLPRAVNPDGSMQTEADWKMENTYVSEGVSIGSNATIMCGISIGKGSIIGAGSVVTKNVPEGVIVAGNPAKILKSI